MPTTITSPTKRRAEFNRWANRVMMTLVLALILGYGALAYLGTQQGGLLGCGMFLFGGYQFIDGVHDKGFLKHLLGVIITGER